MVGRYTLMRQLAKGEVAELWHAAADDGLGEEVALKIVHADSLDGDRDRLYRRLNEAWALRKLRHENLVSLFEVAQDRDLYFMASEYVSGYTFSQLMEKVQKRSAVLPRSILLDLLLGACAGLAAVHQATDRHGRVLQLAHRDVKPSTLMLSRAGEVKVRDLGIAWASPGLDGTTSRHFRGSLPYMAPEQWRDEPAGPAADVFSLGVVMWELVMGRPLFEAADPGQLHTRISRGVGARDAAPCRERFPELEPLISTCLAREPARRYQNASDLQEALEALRGGTPGVQDLAWFVRVLIGDFSRKEPPSGMMDASWRQFLSAFGQTPEAEATPARGGPRSEAPSGGAATGGWHMPSPTTNSWHEHVAPEQRTGGWAAPNSHTGSWQSTQASQAVAQAQDSGAGTGSWDAPRTTETGSWTAPSSTATGGWSVPAAGGTAGWAAPSGQAQTGSWSVPSSATNTGSWLPPEPGHTATFAAATGAALPGPSAPQQLAGAVTPVTGAYAVARPERYGGVLDGPTMTAGAARTTAPSTAEGVQPWPGNPRPGALAAPMPAPPQPGDPPIEGGGGTVGLEVVKYVVPLVLLVVLGVGYSAWDEIQRRWGGGGPPETEQRRRLPTPEELGRRDDVPATGGDSSLVTIGGGPRLWLPRRPRDVRPGSRLRLEIRVEGENCRPILHYAPPEPVVDPEAPPPEEPPPPITWTPLLTAPQGGIRHMAEWSIPADGGFENGVRYYFTCCTGVTERSSAEELSNATDCPLSHHSREAPMVANASVPEEPTQ